MATKEKETVEVEELVSKSELFIENKKLKNLFRNRNYLLKTIQRKSCWAFWP